MGVASIVVGALGILLSWVTCLWPIVAIHVVIGLGLGIADIARSGSSVSQALTEKSTGQRKGVKLGIVGICLNVIAGVLAIVWRLFWQTNGFGQIP